MNWTAEIQLTYHVNLDTDDLHVAITDPGHDPN